MRVRTVLLLVPLFLTGCLPSCSLSSVKPSQEVPVEMEQEVVIEQSSSSTSSSSEIQVSPPVTEGSSSSAAIPWEPKKLNEEDTTFVLAVNEWLAKLREINVDLRILYRSMQGIGAPPEKEIDIQKEYADLHALTEDLAIPSKYQNLLENIQKIDRATGEAVSPLSAPPTLEELENAMNLLRPLIAETNTINTTLSEIRF